jgi:8-oxo-dGTP pyrophosphatase MutT (NUDIX family)
MLHSKHPRQVLSVAVGQSRLKQNHSSPPNRQYAVIPFRLDGNGVEEVLLLTSRGTKRWIIPKGWPMRNMSPAAAAAREAYEEAGLEGRVLSESPIGRFHYRKVDEGVSSELIAVDVFLMRVARQLDTWPEQSERDTRWFRPDRAATLVAEPELAALLSDIRRIAQAIRS